MLVTHKKKEQEFKLLDPAAIHGCSNFSRVHTSVLFMLLNAITEKNNSSVLLKENNIVIKFKIIKWCIMAGQMAEQEGSFIYSGIVGY